VPAELEEATKLGVEVFGEIVPAEIAADVLYDPENERVRA
jgi:hypothetical protein